MSSVHTTTIAHKTPIAATIAPPVSEVFISITFDTCANTATTSPHVKIPIPIYFHSFNAPPLKF